MQNKTFYQEEKLTVIVPQNQISKFRSILHDAFSVVEVEDQENDESIVLLREKTRVTD